MILSMVVEAATEKLATWSTRCSCHERFCKILGPGLMQNLYDKHFHGLWNSCPCSGCRSSDLAMDKLGEVVDELWRESSTILLVNLMSMAGSNLTSEQTERLMMELQWIRVAMNALLRQTMQCWNVLPWVLAGIAHWDEDKARALANKVISQFKQDPRESVHHHRTWRLMQPGASFMRDLEAFAAGRPRSECSDDFLAELARLKFIPWNQTPIEARHSILSRRLGKQNTLGPARVSLSNRLLQFRRYLEQHGKSFMDKFTSIFEECHHVKRAANLVNMSSHPLWENITRDASTLKGVIGH